MRRSGLIATSLIAFSVLSIGAVAWWLARTPTSPPISRHINCNSVAVLAADFMNPAPGETATLTVRDVLWHPGHSGAKAVFEPGDYVGLRMRTSGPFEIADTFGIVTSYADRAEGSQTWMFTRNNVTTTGTMETGAVVPSGALAIDYGFPGKECLGDP